jgi:hypothetical protein
VIVDIVGVDWSGIAQVITAVGVIFLGGLTVWVKRDTKQVPQINQAVNNVGAGQPSLITMVGQAHLSSKANKADIQAVAELLASNVVATDGIRSCVADLRNSVEQGSAQNIEYRKKLDLHIEETAVMKTMLETRIGEAGIAEQS